jgi:hypothetical protein
VISWQRCTGGGAHVPIQDVSGLIQGLAHPDVAG